MTLTVSADGDASAAGVGPDFFLIDRHCLFRQALRALLTRGGAYQVVGEAGSAREALQGVAATQPAVVVIDPQLPDGGGNQLIAALASSLPGSAVIVLSAQRARGAAAAARRAGARAYVLKDLGRQEFMRALHESAAGRWYASCLPAMARGRQRRAPITSATAVAYLNERQRQVLRSVALGYSARQIAGMLGVSVRAVHRQREQLRIALQLNGTADLTRFALREGLLQETPAKA